MILETEHLILREMVHTIMMPYMLCSRVQISYAFDETRGRNRIVRNMERYRKDGFGL